MTSRPPEDDSSSTGAISFDIANRLGFATGAAELVVFDEDGRERERIALTRAPIVIGRQSNNDVVLSDPNVSRRHAELRRNDEGWTLVDLGSTNGTTVNGHAGAEHRLSDGDKLGFGTSELVFKIRGRG